MVEHGALVRSVIGDAAVVLPRLLVLLLRPNQLARQSSEPKRKSVRVQTNIA